MGGDIAKRMIAAHSQMHMNMCTQLFPLVTVSCCCLIFEEDCQLHRVFRKKPLWDVTHAGEWWLFINTASKNCCNSQNFFVTKNYLVLRTYQCKYGQLKYNYWKETEVNNDCEHNNASDAGQFNEEYLDLESNTKS